MKNRIDSEGECYLGGGILPYWFISCGDRFKFCVNIKN